MRRLVLLALGATFVALVGGLATAHAQAAKPAVERLDLDVAAQADRSATVRAKIAIRNVEGLKDATVPHQLSDFPGSTIEGLKATAEDGKSLEVSRVSKDGFDRVLLKLPPEAKGRFVYTLEYVSKCSDPDFRALVIVPDMPVAASVKSFFATVTLPPKMTFFGDELPRLAKISQQGDSTVIYMEEVNIPLFVKAPFGQGSAPPLNATNITTVLSMAFIAGVGYWWWWLKAGH